MRQGKKAQSQYLLARQIIAYVFDEKLDRGHHLVEVALADRFGVSRTLIRAALKRLESERMVKLHRNQGFFLLEPWDRLDRRHIVVPPTNEDSLYRRILRDRINGRIPERITQVALIERYDADRSALLRVLETMADEGIVSKNKGHGWTFLPTIDTELSLRNSYNLRRTLEPNGFFLSSFRVDARALDRIRAAHVAVLERADTVGGSHLFQLDAEFHETIASFTHNAFFIQATQQQNRLRRLMEYQGYENRRRVRGWVREHLAIIEALQVNNPGRAARLMTLHLEKACRAAAAIPAAALRKSDGKK